MFRRHAITTVGLTELAFLVLGLVVIFAFLPGINRTAQAFFGKEDDSVKSFRFLNQKLNTLLGSSGPFAADPTFAFYLEDNYIIVGYNANMPTNKDECGAEDATKPAMCGDSACLCLYKKKDHPNDFGNAGSNKEIECKLYSSVDFFFTIYYDVGYTEHNKVPDQVSQNLLGQPLSIVNENYPPKDLLATSTSQPAGPEDYAFLFLYGLCKDRTWGFSMPDGNKASRATHFAAASLYMERVTDPKDGKTYVFIAYPDDNVLNHSKQMRLKYGQKTAAEFEKRITDLLAANNQEEAYNEYLRFKLQYPLSQLSESTYEQLSIYVIERVKAPETAREELDSALMLHQDYWRLCSTNSNPCKKVPELLLSRGTLYMRTEDYQQAKESYQKILTDYPNNKMGLAATAGLAQVDIIREGPSLFDLEDTAQQSRETLASETSQMSEEQRQEMAAAYYYLGLVQIIQKTLGLPSDVDSKNFEIITQRYPDTMFADDALDKLALLQGFLFGATDYGSACTYLSRIINEYPYAESMIGADLRKKAEQKIELIQKFVQPIPQQCRQSEQALEEASMVPAGATSQAEGCLLQGDYDTTKASEILSAAREYENNYGNLPYTWGGESVTEGGFDCSGLVYAVYRDADVCGFDDRLTSRDYEQFGQKILGSTYDPSQLKPGDLLYIDNNQNGIVDHVAIYIGDNRILHSSSSGSSGIKEEVIPDYYRTRFYSAKRYALTQTA